MSYWWILYIVTAHNIFVFPSNNCTWWRHQMENFPRYWLFVREIHRSPMNSPHKGQWRGALMLSLIWAWINVWVNNRKAGDLGRHCTPSWRHCNDSEWFASTLPAKIWTSWKTQWRHSFFRFRFAECGLAPTTTHILWKNATLTCSVIDEKCNLQSSKSKIHHRIYRNVSFFQNFRIFKTKITLSFHGVPYYIVNLW